MLRLWLMTEKVRAPEKPTCSFGHSGGIIAPPGGRFNGGGRCAGSVLNGSMSLRRSSTRSSSCRLTLTETLRPWGRNHASGAAKAARRLFRARTLAVISRYLDTDPSRHIQPFPPRERR